MGSGPFQNAARAVGNRSLVCFHGKTRTGQRRGNTCALCRICREIQQDPRGHQNVVRRHRTGRLRHLWRKSVNLTPTQTTNKKDGKTKKAKPMRAMRAEQFNGYDELKLVNLPKPAVTDGKVLVRITAAGVTPLDHTILSGKFHGSKAPLVLGNEGAGVVEEGGG